MGFEYEKGKEPPLKRALLRIEELEKERKDLLESKRSLSKLVQYLESSIARHTEIAGEKRVQLNCSLKKIGQISMGIYD